jgi:DNA repair exonuclease SbcCD nuclease subunit
MKNLTILQTSDWHIGESRNTIPDYLARQRKAVNAIFRLAEEQRCDVVVIAGDLFHPFRKVQDGKLWYEVYSTEKDMLLRCLLKADKIGFKIVIINGNHDFTADTVTLLHWITLLVDSGKLKNVIIAEIEPKVVKIGDVNFGLIPFSHHMDSAATIKSWKNIPDLVCVGHEFLSGASTDTNYSTTKGAKLPILENVLAYMWGDIHKHQFIQGQDHAVYAGAPIQHTFGDDAKKGVVIWKNFRPKFYQIKSKPLVTVKEGEEIPVDAYVRVIATHSGIEVPDNCVKVEIDFAETEPISQNPDDLWQGLTEQLARQGLSALQQEEAVTLAKTLMAR